MTYLLALPAPDRKAQTRKLVRTDLYFLLRYLMGRADIEHPWMYARCRQIQDAPDGYLDLWARDHRKSTIITFAKTIQDILAAHGEDPLPAWNGMEPTFGIFSHTRGIALAFVAQIKTELEQNEALRTLFPDVLYDKPEREAPRWSVQNGLTVKRQSNPKEATLEGWGLVDGQPTSKHFNVLLYDDVVVMASVTTPEMIQKTTTSWEFSLNLGDRAPRIRGAGTRWHFADTYRTIIERGALIARIHPATDDGTLTGKPIYLTPEELQTKIRDMGPYSASSQLLLNPIADSKQTFQRPWLEHRFSKPELNWEGMNRVLLCDPASGKKGSDYTALGVLGRAPDGHTYVIDWLRDRLNLKDRAHQFIQFHKRYRPQRCGYEAYGLQADIEYIKLEQERLNYRFEIDELGGKLGKPDRINRLIPLAADGHLWLPEDLYRTNSEGKLEELVAILVEQEFLAWPVPVHDDVMDMIARIFDIEDFSFPMLEVEDKDDRYNRSQRRGRSWMAG